MKAEELESLIAGTSMKSLSKAWDDMFGNVLQDVRTAPSKTSHNRVNVHKTFHKSKKLGGPSPPPGTQNNDHDVLQTFFREDLKVHVRNASWKIDHSILLL